MKHLKIRNLGPLEHVDIELKGINVVIGPQSSGKSCVLKTACYCTWVEKRIELTQQTDFFEREDTFLTELIRFHKLKGYEKQDTYIEYESDYMHFSYNHTEKKFRFAWKEKRWEYVRSKVTYIPAERNMVAAISNWFDVKLANDNIRNFMSDWEEARKAMQTKLKVLNLDVSYRYDLGSNVDLVSLHNGNELDFTNTSSGLQSLIPLYVHLYYLIRMQSEGEKNESIKRNLENMALLQLIYRELFEDFIDKESAEKCKEIYARYINNHFCHIFLEEPEENLFPPTQVQLINWLLDISQEGEYASHLFIATHSPYILTSLLERTDLDLGLFFTYLREDGTSVVKTATDEDMQEIYDNGVDAFFNIETFI